MNFQNYKENNFGDNKDNLDIEFEIKDIPLGLANGLRRALLSNIPTIAFDDTWDDDKSKRNIVIYENTSGLHNEFLAHRLSLIPICMYKNDLFKIQTINKKGIRKFSFVNKDSLPLFSIDIKNNNDTRLAKNSNNMIEVTSEDFKYLNHIEEDSIVPKDIRNFFSPNLITNEFILINILKSNILDDDNGEVIKLECKPNIGFGYIHSRYCPVGTVSFSFKEEDKKITDKVFEQKMIYKDKERIKKNLNPLSAEDKQVLKNSFELLDKQRVYIMDSNNNPSIFKYRVESIGILESKQLVYDGLTILKLKLLDILNSINIKVTQDQLNFNINLEIHDKLSINRTTDNLLGYEIHIDDEDHTIGNLIADYYKHLYVLDNNIDCNIINFVAYQMLHPLKKKILIKMKLNDLVKGSVLSSLFRKTVSKFIDKPELRINTKKKVLEKNLILLVFCKTLLYVIEDIDNLLNQWKNITNIDSSSFIINDEEQYLNLYKNKGHSFNFKDFNSQLKGNGLITPIL